MREKQKSYLKYLEKLEGEYDKTFGLVDTYCEVLLDGVDLNTKEEIMSSILDSFLSAQNDNIPIEKIIGEDIAKFCENACSEIPFKYKIKHEVFVAAILSLITIIWMIANSINDLLNGTKIFDNILYWKTNIGYFCRFPIIIILGIVFKNIRKSIVRKDIRQGKIREKTEIMVIVIYLVIIIGFSVVMPGKINIEISMWVALLIAMFFIIIYKIIYKNDPKYDMDMTESLVNGIISNSKDDLKKINEKKVKKGKREFSEEEYLDYEIKLCKKHLNNYKLVLFIYFAIAIPLSFVAESIQTKLAICGVLFAVLAIITLPSYFLFGRTLRKLNKKLLEKYIYYKENNVKMDDWK